jgi:hypothetical protein
MIDRIVHDADKLTLKGASYRLRGAGIDGPPSTRRTSGETENYLPSPVHFSGVGNNQNWNVVDGYWAF